ncbi:hypothetical protein DZS_32600 [Dickeya ananatis]
MNRGRSWQYKKLYYWQALRQDGEPCTGERIGFERGEIYQYLLELGYQPLRLKTGAYLTPRYWQGPQLSIIVRQLSTLLQAGLPLLDALELLGRQHEKSRLALSVTGHSPAGRPGTPTVRGTLRVSDYFPGYVQFIGCGG